MSFNDHILERIKDETYAIVDQNGLMNGEFLKKFSERLENSWLRAYPKHFRDIIERITQRDHKISKLGKTFLNVDLRTGACTIITLVGSETGNWYHVVATSYRHGKDCLLYTSDAADE